MNRWIAALVGACIGVLTILSEARAADPTPLCTPLWNSSTGAESCVPVGQTGPGGPTNPLPVTAGGAGLAANITQWASGTLGAMANYGTSPGAVLVPGVNAFVTNPISATLAAGTAIAGKFGIDQTTPGTTNGAAIVGVNAATALAGAGATGTGSLRVTAAQDTTTIAGSAPGAAGTASANVVTVQGIASMTKLLVTPDANSTVVATSAANVTATDCSGTITAGGTAQNAFTAQTTLHGFTLVNIDTTEPLWISFTTTAAASGSGSYPLQAATATTFAGPGSFTAPAGFGLNHALSVIAATTSHKYSCTFW